MTLGTGAETMTRGRNQRRKEKRAAPQVLEDKSQKTIIRRPSADVGIHSESQSTLLVRKFVHFSLGKGPIGFVLGIVAALFLQQGFIRLLPGPDVLAHLSVDHITTGNATGCTNYSFEIHSDDALEYVTGKIQVSTEIEDFRFGHPIEVLGPNPFMVPLVVIGRGSDGKCKIKMTSRLSQASNRALREIS